jgi:hypothetical protein
VKDLVIAHRRQWGWRFVDEFCWRNTANGVPGKWPNRLKNAWEPVFHFCRSKEIKFRPKAAGHQSDDVIAYSPDTDVRLRPNACLSSESRCHLRSRPPLALAYASLVTRGRALQRAVLRRSRAPWPPNGAGTDVSPGRSQDPVAPPSAQCSCAHRVKEQSLAVVLQRCVPVFVPRGVRQALCICREAFLLWAWRREA